MATVKIDPLKLSGPWAEGHVLERQHTLSSDFLGHDSFGHAQFDTKRSELGELVFRLKNRSDKAMVVTTRALSKLAASGDADAQFRLGYVIAFRAQSAIEYAADTAFANGAQITYRFDGVCDTGPGA